MDDSVIAELLPRLASPEDLSVWLDAHHEVCRCTLVETLKRFVDTLLNQDTTLARQVAQCALQVVERVPPDEHHRAQMLGHWAMGNAMTCVTSATEGVVYYERALSSAVMLGDTLTQASLTCNIGTRLCQQGQYQEARATIERAREVCPDHAPLVVRSAIEQHYGVVLDCIGEDTAALEAYARAADLARAADDPSRLLEIVTNTAFLYQQRGDLVRAEQTYCGELDNARQHHQHISAARIMMNLGELYIAQGRLSEAQEQLRQAYHGFLRQNDAGDAACAQTHQARLFRMLGLRREAMDHASAAVATLNQLDWKEEQALALMELLRVQRLLFKYAAAAASAESALAIWNALGNTLRRAEVLGEQAALDIDRCAYRAALAAAQASQEQFAASAAPRPLWAATAQLAEAAAWYHLGGRVQAYQAYHRLLHDAQSVGDHWTLQETLLGLGHLEFQAGHFAAAYRYVEQAAADQEMVRRTLTAEELKARFLDHHRGVYDALVTYTATAADAPATLTAMLRAKSGGLLDLIQAERISQSGGDEDVEIESLRRHLAWERVRMRQVQERDSMTGTARGLQTSANEARLLDLLRQRQQHGVIADLTHLLTPKQVAAQLPPETGLLEYYLVDTTLWGVLLTSEGTCHLRMLGTWTIQESDILADLELLFADTVRRASVSRPDHEMDLRPIHRRLHMLWQCLIAPWRAMLPMHLFIAPHGILGGVPFAALWDGSRYLSDTHVVAMLPSGGLLVSPEQPAPHLGPPLVMGYSDHGRLPFTRSEASLVGHLLAGARVYCDTTASSTVLRSLTAPPVVLHIAAHAAVRDDAPLFSTISLSDGEMALETWYDLPLRGTRLAVLSACETGRIADQGGPLLAFQGALLGTGVQTLLCSLWQANDEVAEALMRHFYSIWQGNAPPATALGQAQQRVRATSGLKHPALWAPFICCGTGAFSTG